MLFKDFSEIGENQYMFFAVYHNTITPSFIKSGTVRNRANLMKAIHMNSSNFVRKVVCKKNLCYL